MPTALVTGATGILGREIVKALGEDKATWPTVWALSRSQKMEWPSNVRTKQLDLTASAEEMAKQLEGVQPEIIFFAAYLAKDSEEEATKVNGDMLENFLEALKITGASKRVRRVILTTGAKQYGVHLGVPKLPMEESDRWLADKDRPPNFYYRQQTILKQKAASQGWQYVVTYPNDVIGFARNNFMNLVTTLGIYCAVTKEMGQDLQWPGSPKFYTGFDCFTSSRLHARFNLWAALDEKNPRLRNEAFNVVNGDTESWQNMWPKLAAKFGMKVPEQMFTPEEEAEASQIDESVGSVMTLMDRPPLSEFAAERGLKNSRRLRPSQVEAKIDLVKWSQRSDVKEAWKQLADREGLVPEAFEQATWGFLGFVFGRNFDLVISMSKARKAGWTGYEDTFESLSDYMDELAREKVVPPFK